MYTVVIIEDDPMITRLNRRYVEQDSRFAVVQTFSAAHPALFWLQHNPIDLIILDVYMPQMSGTELLLQLRAKGVDADVIMVTSANDAKTVNDAVRLGAVDYLVKPFAYERFQQALEVFCRRRESVQRDSFSQDALDHTLFRQTAPAPSAAPPKGLQSQTLARIETYLRAAPDERHTSDEIASHVGLSVVTVRRYMNYLTDRQAVGAFRIFASMIIRKSWLNSKPLSERPSSVHHRVGVMFEKDNYIIGSQYASLFLLTKAIDKCKIMISNKKLAHENS